METVKQNRIFDNRKLAALLVPLAADQLLNSFMGTVDTLVVSNLGSAAISAVSLVDSINVLIVQAFFALASGGTVVCSHYLGCDRKDHAGEAARQLVFITFIMSVLIAAVCLVFNGPILKVIFGDVEEAVMENAKQYFFFSAVSYPFIALYDDGSSILRAQENSRLPMQISVASNVINLALNLLFVWGIPIRSGRIRVCHDAGEDFRHGGSYVQAQKSAAGCVPDALSCDTARLGRNKKDIVDRYPVGRGEQHVPVWKACNTVYGIADGHSGDRSPGE